MVEVMLMTGLLLLGSMTDVTCVMMISISMFIVINHHDEDDDN